MQYQLKVSKAEINYKNEIKTFQREREWYHLYTLQNKSLKVRAKDVVISEKSKVLFKTKQKSSSSSIMIHAEATYHANLWSIGSCYKGPSKSNYGWILITDFKLNKCMIAKQYTHLKGRFVLITYGVSKINYASEKHILQREIE